MQPEVNEVTKREEVDLKKHASVKTRKQLHVKRFELDNKDIRDKTVTGQQKTMA